MTAILLWLSFPSVVVGNLLFVVVVLLQNDRPPTEALGDDYKSTQQQKRQIPEPCGPQNLTERRKKRITPEK